MSMKSWIKTLTLALAVAGAATSANAQQFFRIGTGGTAGTYYPVGGMIANSISQPGKLIATAVASNGSVANINGILGGSLEAGFTQSDVAYWAYSGTGTFDGKPKAQDLRLIATLYPESIHLVARKGSGIKTVADLRGKRVSMDEPGSGTLVDVRLILGAFGMTDKDIKAEYLKPNQAGDKLKDGGLDAFFFVSGGGGGGGSELASHGIGIKLTPTLAPD
uniref:TAXI family TRAP transporter solute-binding subunit n=1 Tax=Bordetella pertussis TaxID=520 RepID=UPI00366CE5B4